MRTNAKWNVMKTSKFLPVLQRAREEGRDCKTLDKNPLNKYSIEKPKNHLIFHKKVAIQSNIKYDNVRVTGAFLPHLIGVWPIKLYHFLRE